MLGLVVVVMAAAPGGAADYWPISDDLVYQYERPSGGPHLEVTFPHGRRQAQLTYDDGLCWEWRSYGTDADVDVVLAGLSAYCEGNIDPSYDCSFTPIKWLDLPLEVGKTWYVFNRREIRPDTIVRIAFQRFQRPSKASRAVERSASVAARSVIGYRIPVAIAALVADMWLRPVGPHSPS